MLDVRPARLVAQMLFAATAWVAVGCGDDGSSGDPGGAGASMGSGASGAAGNSGGAGGGATGGGGNGGNGGTVGPIDVETKLPEVPGMRNVVGWVSDDSVRVTFDPEAGAQDYRIYPLPPDEDITIGDDGSVVVKDAIYRCAGGRHAPPAIVDDQEQVQSGAIKTFVEHEVLGVQRTLEDATLGWVYSEPGEGRVAVHALGSPDPGADNGCFFQRWGASRVKRYVADEAEYQQLLAARWRDDGVAFWIPASPGAGARTVYAADVDGAPLYLVDGPEKDARGDAQAAFSILDAEADGTEPLMRVFYENGCGESHDELARGTERFERVRRQGTSPLWEVHWAGITAKTILVIEALDEGCPFQGHLSPESKPSFTTNHQPFMTIDELRAASSTGEVFVNGQYDGGTLPRAVARSFIEVTPPAEPPMDVWHGFDAGEPFEPLTPYEVPWTTWATHYFDAPSYDVSFYAVEDDVYAAGQFLGQLWVTYADVGSDVNGKFRLTSKTKATMSAGEFLHATMQVDTFSTGRRYPQLILSSADAPVQDNLEGAATIIVQPIQTWPTQLDIQVCDHRTWDVNNQCPRYELRTMSDGGGDYFSPIEEISELAGVDRPVRFDVYASTSRVYVFLDGRQAGCADLPAGTILAGPTTVTLGDVLYHSGVDDLQWSPFHGAHLHIETRRHFDDFGFSSGVDAPEWDEGRMPCATTLQ